MVKKSYVDTSCGQVHLRTAGAGEPVVLLHWTPSSGRQYEPVMHELASLGYLCFAPDLLGSGRSDPKPRPFLIADFANNILEVLDALNLSEVFLVGGHVSSEIVTEISVCAPDRVKKVALDGCPVWAREEREKILSAAMKNAPSADEDGELASWAWKKHLWLMRVWNPEFKLDGQPSGRFLDAYIDYLETGFDISGAEALREYDLQSKLTQLNLPALALTATTDPLTNCFDKVKKLVPSCKGYSFHGVHPLHEPKRAKEYAKVLDAFFRGMEFPATSKTHQAQLDGYR